MSRVRFLLAVATVATGGALLVPTVASAHSNAVFCSDPSTSTWTIRNDHPLSETFTSTEGPSGSVAGGNGSYTDVVWNGDMLHVTGTWSDGFVGSTTGSGDCSPEIQPTTTTTIEPTTTTTLVTTTTAQETTTSTTTPPVTTTSTTTVSTTVPAATTTETSATTLPPPSSAPTTPPPTSAPSSPSTSAPSPCTRVSIATPSPGTPTTLPGTPSAPPCGRLPATGNPDLGILTGIAAASIIAGAFMLTKTRR